MPNPLLNQRENNIAEENIIKNSRSLFQLKAKKDNVIKDKTIRNIRMVVESVEEDYYKTIWIGNAFSRIVMLMLMLMHSMVMISVYFEYKSNGEKINYKS